MTHNCKDCKADPPASVRPTPHPGPRCTTHWRVEKKRRLAASHERRTKSVYGLDDYWGLYAYQGGKCAICRWATGKSRRLSVDHDHKTDEVRGLLCRPCNTLLGHARDAVDFFQRCMDYLVNPPYRRWMMERGEAGALDTVPHMRQADSSDDGG